MHVSEIYARLSQVQGNEGDVIIHNFISRVGNLISGRLAIGLSHILRFHFTGTNPDHFCLPIPPPSPPPPQQHFREIKYRKKKL